MSRVPMTVGGAEALRAELENLKKVERPRIVKAIAEAREHGDLKENAEYHAAREQQSFAEGRLQEIESKLADAVVTVSLINLETDEKSKYQIVGDDEADVKSGKISVNSPIARGLIGKSVGDDVVIKTPAGESEFEVDQVEYL
jgi:transcription elongation factor GreA